jgi:hypothetical protein
MDFGQAFPLFPQKLDPNLGKKREWGIKRGSERKRKEERGRKKRREQ